jgi:hypothetical protein
LGEVVLFWLRQLNFLLFFREFLKLNQAKMNYAEMRGMQYALADLTKRVEKVAYLGNEFNRLIERLDNIDSVLKAKLYSISHYILSF